MTLPYQIGDAVFLSREREGIVRYIGSVHFGKGIWCGIELVGGSVGTNDGEHAGRRYFTCSYNRGVLVRICKVRRRFREKDKSSTHRQKRMSSLWQRLSCKSILEDVVAEEMQHCSWNGQLTIKVNDIDPECRTNTSNNNQLPKELMIQMNSVSNPSSPTTQNQLSCKQERRSSHEAGALRLRKEKSMIVQLNDKNVAKSNQHFAVDSLQLHDEKMAAMNHYTFGAKSGRYGDSVNSVHDGHAKCEYEADHALDLDETGSTAIAPAYGVFHVPQIPEPETGDEDKIDAVSRHTATHSLSIIDTFKLFESSSPIPELPEEVAKVSDKTTISEAYATAIHVNEPSVDQSVASVVDSMHELGLSRGSCSPSSFCLTPATIYEHSALSTRHTSTQSIDEQLTCLHNINSGSVKPPRPIPRRRSIGRIKGIEMYTAKWLVTFQGMAPTARKRPNRNGRRLSCVKRKKPDLSTEAYTFSIYKDGSVHVLPKTAFGWNGVGTIVADAENQRFTIHSTDLEASDEYEKISLTPEGTLQIEHFASRTNSAPIMGTGVLA